jgi:hypothetical protein
MGVFSMSSTHFLHPNLPKFTQIGGKIDEGKLRDVLVLM